MKTTQNFELSQTAQALIARALSPNSSRDAARAAKSFARPAASEFAGLVCTPEQASAMNQKGAMRTAQACDFATSGDARACDGVTAALVALVILSSQTRVSFSDAHIIAGASKEGNAVNGVSRARIARFIPRTSNLGTITSKTSRTVGRGTKGRGLLDAMGITNKGDVHGFEIVNRAHPFLTVYASALAKMTDGDFVLLTAPKGDK